MSYDTTTKIQNSRLRAELRVQTETEDKARDQFLKSLVGRVTPCAPLTEFEEKFVDSWAASPKSQQWWTPKRRDVADELRRKYS